MKQSIIYRTGILLFLTATFAGCATNPGIVKAGPDTYSLYAADHGGIFGNAVLLRTNVISQANAYAEGQGKIALPVSAKTHPMGICCGDWATFEYQFRVVDKNDSTVRRTHLIPGTDVVADDTGKVLNDTFSAIQPVKSQQGERSDTYAELSKLDDLRKKDIINEAEFEAEKKKILSRN